MHRLGTSVPLALGRLNEGGAFHFSVGWNIGTESTGDLRGFMPHTLVVLNVRLSVNAVIKQRHFSIETLENLIFLPSLVVIYRLNDHF